MCTFLCTYLKIQYYWLDFTQRQNLHTWNQMPPSVFVYLPNLHVPQGAHIWRGSNQHGDIMVQRSRKFGAKMISNEDLKKLPCFDYEAAEKGTSCVDCAVCLENFKMGDKCRLLPDCRHSFHVQCIDSWLLKTPICPICRTCIIPLKVEVIISEESSVSDNIAVELTS
ncbi:hypothetical protein RGQ29_004121 [Quercus rubra]|uniref:RING-type E3 ubiquitin transferase n=1 Tax=Quercus rubra TaxID=3512 RepID=A0AAN7EDE6_QUERU|nr:hypothetical protein RGQ29_004121 [Quercus rubra]